MKILSVSQYYPPHIGGLENVAYKQAVTLHASGHTVRVLTCAGERERVGCTHDSGIAVVRVRAWNIFEKKFGIPFPLMGVGLLWHMWREVRRAEVVHVHDVFYMTSWAAYLFARMYRRPIILTQHVAIVEHTSALVMHAQRVVYATFGKLLFRGARTVIVYNENVRNFLLTYGVLPTNIRLIHNGIDTTLYHPPTNATEKQEARQTFGLPKDRPLALFVGRFVPKKGFDVVYGARDPAYDLVFAGSGDFPEEWKHTEGVYFLGAQNQEQLSKLYRAVDLLVSPNLGEVFTLVIQEAMSSGLPVITTDDPGYTSYELDRTGIILCSPTPDVVRQHITSIVSDTRVYAYMSACSLHLAHEHFDWDKNSSVILDMYAVLEHEQQIQQEVTVRPTPTTGQKKRLMVVAPYFYPKIGGVENYAYNLAHRLHEQGDYDVSVITSNPDVTAKKYVRSELDGMTVHYLPVWKTLSNTPLNLLWFFQIRKITQEEQPDIINVHSPVPFMADMAMLAAGKTPVVVTYHSGSMIKNQWLIDSIIYVYEKIFLNLLFWRVSAIVAVSYNFIYGPWGKKFAKKTMLIRPGVDTSHFTPTSLPDTKVVTYVGRIEHSSSWKGIEQLLQAMAIVVSHHPDARLEIVGSGDAVEHYKQRAQELGIGHAVTMAGARAGQDLVDAYRRSNVVVLPSTSEAEQSSVVLIEAMASGRPVIGTQIGGTPYIVHDQENGLLVPPRDPEALAQAIERVLTDDTLAQDLAHGALLSAQKVDWRVQIEQYKTLFTSLIQKRTPSRIFNFSFSRISIVAFIVAWWSIVVLLSLKDSDPLGLLNILGFSFLLFVPGFLTLSIVGLRNLEPWVRVSMMIAISILELILAALVANTLLPLIGIEQPLSKVTLIITVSLLVLTLSVLF